jgi:hypothetical protein
MLGLSGYSLSPMDPKDRSELTLNLIFYLIVPFILRDQLPREKDMISAKYINVESFYKGQLRVILSFYLYPSSFLE